MDLAQFIQHAFSRYGKRPPTPEQMSAYTDEVGAVWQPDQWEHVWALCKDSRYCPSPTDLWRIVRSLQAPGGGAYVDTIVEWERIRASVFERLAESRGTRRIDESELRPETLREFRRQYPSAKLPPAAHRH